MNENPGREHDMLTPGTVARMFGVDVKTVGRWASTGYLPHVRTVGNHRRFRRDVVEAVLHRRPRTFTGQEDDR